MILMSLHSMICIFSLLLSGRVSLKVDILPAVGIKFKHVRKIILYFFSMYIKSLVICVLLDIRLLSDLLCY